MMVWTPWIPHGDSGVCTYRHHSRRSRGDKNFSSSRFVGVWGSLTLEISRDYKSSTVCLSGSAQRLSIVFPVSSPLLSRLPLDIEQGRFSVLYIRIPLDHGHEL